METSAIILAAGSGTRMKSAKPKVAHELLGKPLVRWVVDAAREAGVGTVISVLGHGIDVVRPLVEHDTQVVVQQQRNGTADAVNSAREACEGMTGSLLVLSGDCPLIRPETIAGLARAREEADAAVAVLTMEAENPFGYGRIIRDAQGQVECIVEQKDCTPEQAAVTECNSGFYCFDAQYLFDALNRVSNENAQGEFYLTDVIGIARADGRSVVALCAEDPEECLGINTRLQLSVAAKVMQRRMNTAFMLAGVTIEQDVELLPQTMLMGKTSVASGSVIGPNTRLTDTVVGHDCVLDETVAVEAVIEDGCHCGPRAYLRPQTRLCEGAKAGTHVEIKKSTIGKGSKVPHLSYIGDTTMGDGVNIGAGSITCNYDGQNKWPTVIGDNTFIGSDTMMVAPVTIGDDALVGAGSVITADVPDGALALGRARQIIKTQHK